MRILLVSKHFWPENFRINAIIKKLSVNNSIQVISEVPSYQKRFHILKKKINKNINIERVKTYPRGKSLLSILFNYISFCTMGSFKVLKQKKTDIVFVYATSPIFQAIPAIIYGKIKKVPVCIWVQDLWPEVLEDLNIIKKKFIIRFLNNIINIIYRFSDFIFVQSKEFKKCIDKRSGKKTIIFYNPEEKNNFSFNINKSNKKIITFAGNIGKAQNLEIIIQAFKKKKIKNIVFHIYGNGNNKKNLEKLILQNELKDRIKIYKPVNKSLIIKKLIKSDALFISLGKGKALSKTIPAKFQTYLSIGKPLIFSGEGELKNIIKDYKLGFTSGPNDIDGFIRSIQKINTINLTQKRKIFLRSEKLFNRFFELNDWSKSLEDKLKECIKIYNRK